MRMNLIARMHPGWYTGTTDLVRLERVARIDREAYRDQRSLSKQLRWDPGAVPPSHLSVFRCDSSWY